jgi:hypothetical protein
MDEEEKAGEVKEMRRTILIENVYPTSEETANCENEDLQNQILCVLIQMGYDVTKGDILVRFTPDRSD